jgi:hypothetical protein
MLVVLCGNELSIRGAAEESEEASDDRGRGGGREQEEAEGEGGRRGSVFRRQRRH